MAKRRRHAIGLLDTSVVIDLQELDPQDVPIQGVVSALTLAELAAGTHAGSTKAETARRQDKLQRVEAEFNPVPFGANAARAYARIYAAEVDAGRKPRGARTVDLMIAATALAEGLPLYTRNAADFRSLEGLVEVIEV